MALTHFTEIMRIFKEFFLSLLADFLTEIEHVNNILLCRANSRSIIIIVQFLHFTTKNETFVGSRQEAAKSLLEQGLKIKISIYPDFTKEITNERRSFSKAWNFATSSQLQYFMSVLAIFCISDQKCQNVLNTFSNRLKANTFALSND